MNPEVSVVMCVRNAEMYLANCLESILNQTFRTFEIVLVDDMSTDSTADIIQKFDDPRIRYYRNKEWLRIAKSRNVGVRRAKGRYLFFTDADCTVSADWIREGLKFLKDKECLGVEGRIIYVSEKYRPTFSDHVMENKTGGHFMTGNIAYKKSVFENVGGFDERMSSQSDRDFGLKVAKTGIIQFNPKMVAYHPRVVNTPKMLVKSASNTRNRVFLLKKYGENKFSFFRLIFPQNFAKFLFPPLTFAALLTQKFKSEEDFRLLPYTYVYVVLERIQLWRNSAREKVFLI